MAESEEPKWIQRETELEKLERTFAAFSKANELGKYLQKAFGPMPTNLPQSFAFQASGWKNLADAQRIFDRFDQIARLAKSFPTEAELEARYERQKKAVLILAKRGWFIPLRMTTQNMELGDVAEHGHEVYPSDVPSLGYVGSVPLLTPPPTPEPVGG